MDLKEVRQEELYEQFQQWLNDCPVKMIDYQDFTDQFQITFEVNLEDENS